MKKQIVIKKQRVMKKQIKQLRIAIPKLIFSLFLCFCWLPQASAEAITICPNIYLGFDGQHRHTTWHTNYGGNLFKKNYPQGNVFVGVEFNDYVGFEVGYEDSVKKTRFSSLPSGTIALGIPVGTPNSPVPFSPPVLHYSTAQFKGWNYSLIGYIPFYRPDCSYFFGSIGAVNLRIAQSDQIVQDSINAFRVNALSSTFKKSRNVFTLGFGWLFLLDEVCAFRVRLVWENTEKIRRIVAKQSNINGIGILKPQNTFIYGIGVVFKIL